MLCLIITADDALFQRLLARARADGDMTRRAVDALAGLELAVSEMPRMIMIDMALRSADTLLEALHRRAETAAIPLLAVAEGAQVPFDLRRLCAAVLDRSAV